MCDGDSCELSALCRETRGPFQCYLGVTDVIFSEVYSTNRITKGVIFLPFGKIKFQGKHVKLNKNISTRDPM